MSVGLRHFLTGLCIVLASSLLLIDIAEARRGGGFGGGFRSGGGMPRMGPMPRGGSVPRIPQYPGPAPMPRGDVFRGGSGSIVVPTPRPGPMNSPNMPKSVGGGGPRPGVASRSIGAPNGARPSPQSADTRVVQFPGKYRPVVANDNVKAGTSIALGTSGVTRVAMAGIGAAAVTSVASTAKPAVSISEPVGTKARTAANDNVDPKSSKAKDSASAQGTGGSKETGKSPGYVVIAKYNDTIVGKMLSPHESKGHISFGKGVIGVRDLQQAQLNKAAYAALKDLDLKLDNMRTSKANNSTEPLRYQFRTYGWNTYKKDTQRLAPSTPQETALWRKVVDSPASGKDLELKGDPGFRREKGWQKMQLTDANGNVIHYQYNTRSGVVTDVKLVSKKKDKDT